MSSDGSRRSTPIERELYNGDCAASFDGVRQQVDTPPSLSGVAAKRLADVLARVMSPDALSDADAWRDCTARAIRDLVSADAAYMVLESGARRTGGVGFDDALDRRQSQSAARRLGRIEHFENPR